MTFIKSLIPLFLIIVICSCAEKEDKQTKILSGYLDKNFKLAIPDSLQYYFLIPKLGCAGCDQKLLVELNKIDYKNKNIILITSKKKDMLYDLIPPVPVLYDTLGTLDVLNLNLYNVCIVKTKNRKINFIKSLTNETAEDINSIFSKDY
jgi:hypothetical protein